MDMFPVAVRVSNPRDPARSFDERFWVDTGALYTIIGGFLGSAPAS